MKKLPVTLSFKKIEEVKLEMGAENYAANFVSTLFSENLTGSKLPRLDRVTIELTDNSSEVMFMPPNKFVNVCQIRWFVNASEYILLTEKEDKYKFLLERLMEAIHHASKELNWPLDAFEESKASLIGSSFTKKINLIKEQKSPSKNNFASVVLNFGELENVIFLKVGDEKTIELFKLSILENDFTVIAKKIRWVNESKIEVSNNDNEVVFEYDITTDNLEMIIIPRVNSEEYIRDELKLLDARTTKEDYVKISQKRLTQWDPPPAAANL